MTKAIDSTFAIDSDKYNWILREKKIGKKVKLHFFSSIKHLARFVGEYKLREFLVEVEVDLIEKSAETPSYSSVIDQSVLKLEQWIESIVSKDDSKR
ncbi:hypothetical protein N9R34_01580 [Candidatus Thioglobus sp.]|jgi:hypothetical protein|nr:hypothetical protein [Candidatus Thioglobus sp.]